MQHIAPVTTTEHKIGKVTYLVCSSASERATDTLDKKIKKLISYLRKGGFSLKKDNLLRYSMQLAFLKQLLEKKLISDREYSLIKSRLMKDYKIVSDLLS